MGIARVSRTLLILVLALALLAAAACRDDDKDDDAERTAPVETPTVTAAADADAGAAHDNGDADAGKGYDRGDSGAMDKDEPDLESILELVGMVAAMSEFAGEPDGPAGYDGYDAGFGVIGDAQDAGIWVNGVGSVSAPPDVAELDLGVSATAETVSEARGSAAKAMTAIVGFLTANGVADKDIRTRRFSIQPQYDWQERFEEGVRRSERVLTGYEVSNVALVTVRALDRVSALIDGAAAAAGDLVRVNGIRFVIEDPAPLADEARDEAVENALAEAEALADAAGVTLGRLVYLAETGAGDADPSYPLRAFALTEADAGAATPVNPGEQEVRVTVRAVFDIA